jgi:hypothetical protein
MNEELLDDKQAYQDPPCVHTLATGKHEWNCLHSKHQANDPIWIPYCPTCGWIDTRKMLREIGLKTRLKILFKLL